MQEAQVENARLRLAYVLKRDDKNISDTNKKSEQQLKCRHSVSFSCPSPLSASLLFSVITLTDFLLLRL